MAEQGKDSGGKETQHRNDMYGNIDARGEGEEGVSKTIPAATVVLLRDGSEGVEVLMLKKNSKITFGGMWVFPGGKIDPEDYPSDGDVDVAYRSKPRELSVFSPLDATAWTTKAFCYLVFYRSSRGRSGHCY